MADDWTRSEVDLAIDTYFSMLDLQVTGTPYVKSHFTQPLATQIGRSKKSVEFKFMNISAVLDEEGQFYIDGYKPAPHYQGLLRDRVLDELEGAVDLVKHMADQVNASASASTGLLRAPKAPPTIAAAKPGHVGKRSGRFVDYQLLEQQNRALGLAGEEAVVERERRLLTDAGAPELAKKVRHVAVLDGDGLGYDVRSYQLSGASRFLEVKTTRSGPAQRFFVSRNEVEFSQENPTAFFARPDLQVRYCKHGLLRTERLLGVVSEPST